MGIIMIIKKMVKEEVLEILNDMFEIINNNMEDIVETNNSKEENYKIWKESMLQELDNNSKRWVGAFLDNTLVGYFLYRVLDKKVYLDEVQLREDRQGDKITFISLMKELLNDEEIDDDYQVYLYVNDNNKRSLRVVQKLGFKEFEKLKKGKRYYNDFVNLKNCINNY